MKRVLFIIPSFTVGGTVVSLAALLSEIKDRYDIDIYSRSALGVSRELFKDYNILKENIWLSNTIRSRGLLLFLLSLSLQLLLRLFSCFGISLLSSFARIGSRQIKVKSYDIVIAYQESLAALVQYFPGKKAIWIHSDIRRSNYKCSFEAFDFIVCVSQFAEKSFLTVFPHLSNKTRIIYNQINEKYIKEKAGEQVNIDQLFDSSKFTIISVGRFDPVKQFDKIPMIAYNVKKEIGSRFTWYIVGYNHHYKSSRDSIQSQIDDLSLSSEVILLEEKKNIFPYIEKSDVLVITSESETFSLVAFEARVLGTPIIINDIPIAHEIIKDNSGFISQIEDMPKSIINIYRTPFRVHSFERLSLLALSNFDGIVG